MDIEIPKYHFDESGNAILDEPSSGEPEAAPEQPTEKQAGQTQEPAENQVADTAAGEPQQTEQESEPTPEQWRDRALTSEKRYNDLLSYQDRKIAKRTRDVERRIHSEYDAKLKQLEERLTPRKQAPDLQELDLSDPSKLDAYIKAKASDAARETFEETLGNPVDVKENLEQSKIAMEYQTFKTRHPEYVKHEALLDPILAAVLRGHPEATYERAYKTVKDVIAIATGKLAPAKPLSGEVGGNGTTRATAPPSKRELTAEEIAKIDKKAERLKTEQDGVSLGSRPTETGPQDLDAAIRETMKEAGLI